MSFYCRSHAYAWQGKRASFSFSNATMGGRHTELNRIFATCSGVSRIWKWASKLGVTSKTGDPKPLFRGSFTTTLQLKYQYLSNKTHYRPTETETLNYEGSLQFTQRPNLVKFGPPAAEIALLSFPPSEIFACRAGKPSINQSINQSINLYSLMQLHK